MKTDSEVLFEEFCQRNGFACNRVLETTTKTPDYSLTFGGLSVIVEVKEVLVPTDEEWDRIVRERELIDRTPGKVVRRKIGDCSKQIKARTAGRHPGMLVLYENGQCAGKQTEPYHIRVAMEGFEQVVLAVPPLASGGRPSVVGMNHGGSRKMTKDANTSISAVALLCTPGPNKVLLQVFHNRYAAIPLDPALMRSAEVIHYALVNDPTRTTKWTEIE
jgi:hypothetical protein